MCAYVMCPTQQLCSVTYQALASCQIVLIRNSTGWHIALSWMGEFAHMVLTAVQVVPITTLPAPACRQVAQPLPPTVDTSPCLPLQMCRDGAACTRKICFFAHEEKDLRTPLVLDATATAEQKVLQQEAALQHSLHLEHLKQHAVAVQQLLQQQQPPQQPQQEQQHQGSQSPGGSEPQLTLQQLQERVNIWRAVQEAAAQTGFTLLPSPLAPAAAALPQVCSTDAGFLISPQPASPVPSVDAVCDAPLRMPLPLAQRAPGAPCACTTGHDMSAALCQLLQGPGQQGGLAISGVGCELGCITECTGDCGLLSSIASSPFGSPPPTSSLHGLGWAAAGSVGSPVLGGGGWPLMPNAVPRGAAYPVGPCQQLGGMSPAAIAAGRMGMGFGMGGLPGSGLEGHAW